MKVEIGDIYIRHSDGKTCRVKKIDHTMVVVELESEARLSMTSIFGLGKGYSKKEPVPHQ